MTIDPLCLQETTSIAKPAHFYPADIEVAHHQLRNLISTFYDRKIFYVNKYDIYILDLDSHQRTLLVTVPFEARCLAAAHGWVCVGGETKGDCAFVHIGEDHGQPGNFCHELIVEMLGKDIVNAMNIQQLKADNGQGRDELVVLISSNDRTVTIFSLDQRVILTTIEHPRCMNYAALSPDSTVMAAVGDENKVYFLKRSLVNESPSAYTDPDQFPEYDWRPMATPDVPKGFEYPEDFSFAIAFSPDGCLCAVSSQGGIITVFDMDAILDELVPPEEAIVCSFRSSRQNAWGFVRSMAFSPASWNILAWAEDHGVIGLADVRQGFLRRQHLHLDKTLAKKVDVRDATPMEWKNLDVKERLRRQHQQRMQALRGHPPVGARMLNESRERSTTATNTTNHVASSLSEREQSVVRALDSTIDETGPTQQPYSINYSPIRTDTRATGLSADLRREYEIQLLNPASRLVPSHIPRRRSSVILSESLSSSHLMVDETSRMTMTASPGPMSDDGTVPPMSTNDLTPASNTRSSQPLPYNIPPSHPWHVIEANLASLRSEFTPLSRQPTGLREIENAIYAERQLEARIERQMAIEQRLSTELRSELDMRERLLQSQQQGGQSGSLASSEPSSLEQGLARQLVREYDHGQLRSEEMEMDIRNMSRRINQLMQERDNLLQRHGNSTGNERTIVPSARSSALPTTLTRVDLTDFETRMRRIEQERRSRTQRINDMEQDVRNAETTIELVSIHNEALQQQSRDQPRFRPRPRANERHDPSTVLSRNLATSQSNSTTPLPNGNPITSPNRLLDSFGDPTSRRLRTRPTAEMGLSSNRATVSRITGELTQNRISNSDVYIARAMMTRSNMNNNGDWSLSRDPAESQGPNRVTSIEEILREGGIGTTGIGWSSDGLKLFAGSEHGIFEFDLNVEDRLQCPLVELR